MAATRLPSLAGLALSPRALASASSTRLSSASPSTPRQHAGSSSTGVRPSKRKRQRAARASSITHAAVTPRAPPETTTTDCGSSGKAEPAGSGAATVCNTTRAPSTGSPTSRSTPPASNSAHKASATSSGERPTRPMSMARTCAEGHSMAAVRARAAGPASQARSLPDRPKSPPVSCTVTKVPPSLAKRAATARAARSDSRFTATTSSMQGAARRPPRKITASASAGISCTSLALAPRAPSFSTKAAPTPAPSSVTTRLRAATRPGVARPKAGAPTARSANRPIDAWTIGAGLAAGDFSTGTRGLDT